MTDPQSLQAVTDALREIQTIMLGAAIAIPVIAVLAAGWKVLINR